MRARLATILVTVPIILACTYYGGFPFLFMVLFLALFCINEFYALMMRKGYFPAFWVGNLITIFFIVFAYYATKQNWEPSQSVILTIAVTIAAISGIFLKREDDTSVDVSITVFGMLYCGWFFGFLIFIRALTAHGGYLFFLMFTVWAQDVVAYMVGRYFGKHKLAPAISPNKTWEGAVAGFITCLIAAEIFSGLAPINGQHALILGALIGIMAQLSDLVESIIKRDAKVKDSSNILPGHGGFLDRLDAFILTAPLMYYYVVWVILK